MRINKYLAERTGMSRRSADKAIVAGQVTINGQKALPGALVHPADEITVAGRPIDKKTKDKVLILLHKPVGYVCSRNGQGSPTVYELLPADMQHLRTVGRLDKDSSGLLLLTNDGKLVNRLSHPKYEKVKTYRVTLDKPLSATDKQHIARGVELYDGVSTLQLSLWRRGGRSWIVDMHEGRNRQIRRTFAALEYKVIHLHRIRLDTFELGDLPAGGWRYANNVSPSSLRS